MKRNDFIELFKRQSREELIKIANNTRQRFGRRTPPKTFNLFFSENDTTDCEERIIGGTRIFKIKDKNKNVIKPVIIYLHGGGWTMPHLKRDEYFCRRLARKTGCMVIDIDYVLAPEHPYPSALEEIETLLIHLVNLIPEWKGDLNRMLLVGLGSGGNLCAALLHRGYIPFEFRILCLILCCIPTDNYSIRNPEEDLNERDQKIELHKFNYNVNYEERKKPDVSLVFAEINVLKNLPVTHIITAGQDSLKEDGERYFKKLQQVGVPSTYRCFENSHDDFIVKISDEWKEAEDYITKLILETLGKLAFI